MFGLHIIRRSARVKNMQHRHVVCNVAAPCSHVRVHVCRRKEYVSAATRMSAYASWCKRQVATAPWHEVSGPVLEQCGSRDLARGARARRCARVCVCVCLSVGARARSSARAGPQCNYSRLQLTATEELRTAVGAKTFRPREAARTWAELWRAGTIGQDTMRSSVREA